MVQIQRLSTVMYRTCLAIVSTLVLAAATALAADELMSPSAACRKHYESGKFSKCLDLGQKTLETAPVVERERLLSYLGLSALALKKNGEATRFFRLSLERNPNHSLDTYTKNPEFRQFFLQVRDRFTKNFEIRSDTEGVVITLRDVNGVVIARSGEGEGRLSRRLALGRYHLQVTGTKYHRPDNRQYEITENSGSVSEKVDLESEPIPKGVLTVAPCPIDARIVLTDTEGNTLFNSTEGLNARLVPVGDYTLTVSQEGYLTLQRKVSVRANEPPNRIDVPLKPDPERSLQVELSPADSTLLVKGDVVEYPRCLPGLAVLPSQTLPPLPFTLTARAPGHLPGRVDVVAPKGSLKVDLVPSAKLSIAAEPSEAIVRVFDGAGAVILEGTGSVEQELPVGAYTYRVTCSCYIEKMAAVTITAGKAIAISDRLDKDPACFLLVRTDPPDAEITLVGFPTTISFRGLLALPKAKLPDHELELVVSRRPGYKERRIRLSSEPGEHVVSLEKTVILKVQTQPSEASVRIETAGGIPLSEGRGEVVVEVTSGRYQAVAVHECHRQTSTWLDVAGGEGQFVKALSLEMDPTQCLIIESSPPAAYVTIAGAGVALADTTPLAVRRTQGEAVEVRLAMRGFRTVVDHLTEAAGVKRYVLSAVSMPLALTTYPAAESVSLDGAMRVSGKSHLELSHTEPGLTVYKASWMIGRNRQEIAGAFSLEWLEDLDKQPLLLVGVSGLPRNARPLIDGADPGPSESVISAIRVSPGEHVVSFHNSEGGLVERRVLVRPGMINVALLTVLPPEQWPFERGPAGQTGALSYEALSPPFMPVWESDGWNPDTRFAPISADGKLLFIQKKPSAVVAVDVRTGVQAWRHPSEDGVETPLVADSLSVYYVDGSSQLVALGQRSDQSFARTLPIRIEDQSYDVTGAPGVANGKVFLGSEDLFGWGSYPRLFAVSSQKARAMQILRTDAWPVQVEDNSDLGAVMFLGSTVFLGASGGRLYGYDAESGRQLFSFNDEKGGGEANRPPAADQELVVFSTDAGHVYALTHRGYERWHYFEKGCSAPTLSEHGVFITAGKRLVALSRSDGRPRWSYEHSHDLLPMPAVTFHAVIAAGEDGTLLWFDPDNGALRWRYRSPVKLACSPIIYHDQLLIFDNKGTLRAFVNHGSVDSELRRRALLVRMLELDEDRRDTAKTLANLGLEAVPALLEAVHRDDWSIRAEGVSGLARLGAPAIPELLSSPYLERGTEDEAEALAHVLGAIGDKQAIPVLVRMLAKGRGPGKAAITALTTILPRFAFPGDEEYLPVLGMALEMTPESLLMEFRRIFAAAGAAGIPQLKAALNSESRGLFALGLMEEIARGGSLQPVQVALLDFVATAEERPAGERALALLGEIGNREALPRLEAVEPQYPGKGSCLSSTPAKSPARIAADKILTRLP